jgi:uncharacterized protein
MEIVLSEDVSAEYIGLVRGILANEEFCKLTRYTHHHSTTRLMHSLNVSYLSWRTAKALGLDERVAARAGLLHDFCVYDFRQKLPNGQMQAFYHPKAAVQTSEQYFALREKERQAILSHMFPLGPLPRSREAWVISSVDKVCACAEFFRFRLALARNDRVRVLACAA